MIMSWSIITPSLGRNELTTTVMDEIVFLEIFVIFQVKKKPQKQKKIVQRRCRFLLCFWKFGFALFPLLSSSSTTVLNFFNLLFLLADRAWQSASLADTGSSAFKVFRFCNDKQKFELTFVIQTKSRIMRKIKIHVKICHQFLKLK